MFIDPKHEYRRDHKTRKQDLKLASIWANIYGIVSRITYITSVQEIKRGYQDRPIRILILTDSQATLSALKYEHDFKLIVECVQNLIALEAKNKAKTIDIWKP